MAIKVTGKRLGSITKKRAEFREGSKTISNADRRIADKMLKEMTGEGAKNISKIDKSRAKEIMESYENYMKRNDGGIAKKTRTF